MSIIRSIIASVDLHH